MKISKKVLGSALTAAVLSVSAMAPVANAELAASAGVASTYLWRGYDLGSGTPAVSGDIQYDREGFYTGVWASSGDTSAGTEFDLYVGYGIELGGITVDASLWNYNYPSGPDETDFADLTEFVLSVGFGPVSATIYENVAGDNGYTYGTVSANFGAFDVTLGHHNSQAGNPNSTHLDVSYAYNDNLSFTLSQFVDNNPEGDDLKVVVAYSLPIE